MEEAGGTSKINETGGASGFALSFSFVHKLIFSSVGDIFALVVRVRDKPLKSLA